MIPLLTGMILVRDTVIQTERREEWPRAVGEEGSLLDVVKNTAARNSLREITYSKNI